MYEEAKDYLRKMFTERVDSGYGQVKPRLNKREVTASTFTYLGGDGKLNHEWCTNTACHATVYSYGKPSLICMMDSIQHVTYKPSDETINHDDKRAWLKYFMDHPIFGKTFLEHDPDVALEEEMTVRDIGSLPANVCMFALIAIRALWESFQYKLPRRFRTLLELGLTPDVAFILSWYVDKDLTLSTMLNSGHSCISTAHITNEWVKNYLTHNPVSVASGTLKDKVNQTDFSGENNKWSVFGIFDEAANNIYGSTSGLKRFELTVKKFFGSEVTKEKLLAFEKELLHA